jgi:hypothetical protein
MSYISGLIARMARKIMAATKMPCSAGIRPYAIQGEVSAASHAVFDNEVFIFRTRGLARRPGRA